MLVFPNYDDGQRLTDAQGTVTMESGLLSL